MEGITTTMLTGLVLLAAAFAFVPAPAAAHDNNCDAAVHIGPAHAHQGCESKYKGDETECTLSYNIGPVHGDILCD